MTREELLDAAVRENDEIWETCRHLKEEGVIMFLTKFESYVNGLTPQQIICKSFLRLHNAQRG